MKLSKKEEFISEYKFNTSEKKTNQAVLTTKRFVVIKGSSEESYPLSKITAVKVVFKQWKILMYFGIGLFALIPLSVLLGGVGGYELLIFSVIPFVLILLGLRKSTILQIDQMGGEQSYKVYKYDEKLESFIEKVNEALF